MIEPGQASQIQWADGNWIFLDIGFSNNSRSCGLLMGDGVPISLRFCEAKEQVVQRLVTSTSQANLVIEAPLSVCFDRFGNPKGRSIEIEGSKTRYWYNGPGCAVMTAAMYLMREIHQARPVVPMVLFEGFVSYKDSERSSHEADVCLLRDVVLDPKKHSESIYTADLLKRDSTDELFSAFRVVGLDYGVPTVIKPKAAKHSSL